MKEGKLPHKLVGLLLMAFVAMVPVVGACGGGASGPTEAGPDSSSPLAVAPDFTAQEADGGEVTLSEALQQTEKIVLVFYRGVF